MGVWAGVVYYYVWMFSNLSANFNENSGRWCQNFKSQMVSPPGPSQLDGQVNNRSIWGYIKLLTIKFITSYKQLLVDNILKRGFSWVTRITASTLVTTISANYLPTHTDLKEQIVVWIYIPVRIVMSLHPQWVKRAIPYFLLSCAFVTDTV